MNLKDIKFDQSDIDNFINKCTYKSIGGGWKIKINGEFIKLSSGKSVWASKGFAKSALKNHLYRFPRELLDKYLKSYPGWKDENKFWNHFLDFLQERGILEFVELN